MRLLIDTHALIWWAVTPRKLSSPAAAAIRHGGNDILVSVAGLWEITIKRSIGKLQYPGDLESVLSKLGFDVLQVTFEHLRRLDGLPMLHRDPFDRMLAAQALAEGIPIVTHDPLIHQYGPATIW